MASDFFLINNTTVETKDALDFNTFDDLNSSIHTKVALVELNTSNLDFLNSISKDQIQDSVFIYLKSDIVTDLNQWWSVFNKFHPDQLIAKSEVTNETLTKAIHNMRKKKHDKDLKKLVSEKDDLELSLQRETLSKLEDKNKRLLRNSKRAQHTHSIEKLNLDCLESIFNSKSIGEIEDKITEILSEPFKIDWVRILVSPSDILTELPTIKFQNQFEIKIFDLDYDSKVQGRVIFASKKGRYIKESNVPLLQKISDALSLRLKQIETDNEIEVSNLQWESTFKALPFKAALITKDYKVLEHGGLFTQEKLHGDPHSLCYERFFSRSEPCEGCRLGETYIVDQQSEPFEVSSKEIFDPINDEHYYLNFYRDFEVSTLGESGKATKTKLEELGVISGSIAHELNNPLGGIKILLELLKEDPELSSSEYNEDLKVLMASTEKCIQIVSELLNFTRVKKDTANPEIKTIEEHFKQLQVFTQAFLLSEGIVLQVSPGAYLKQKIVSSDSTLAIKLLEAVSQLSKKINKKNLRDNQTIHLSGELNENKSLCIRLSSLKPNESRSTPEQEAALAPPISIVPKEGAFEDFISSEQEQTLTLKFSTEVKLNETHV
jgi:hypothetical protein